MPSSFYSYCSLGQMSLTHSHFTFHLTMCIYILAVYKTLIQFVKQNSDTTSSKKPSMLFQVCVCVCVYEMTRNL